ncbi:hypothetical protein [Ulvibacterium sp.]|uniref:hypothetical protein n=1 Tax=Ulvibacterium sp. TaxID=2665914 RepID=UPI00262DBB7C|nr:hypothetical protein [Ulvibacterium sp.]
MSQKVIKDVKAYIGSHTGINPNRIKDEYVLKKHPLKFDDAKLAFLALSLRGYIKSHNPSATILVKELRKKDLDVKKTYELVIQRIGQ